ncbi:DUF4397 domain-containing protein [Marixanthomonas spongiae]|nr:DUF4397 domain-containing protein [Marixanthomonas spongiae]
MKKLLLICFALLASTVVFSQTARVQVIHNSADALAAEVDVYIDADLTLDDFAFRTATPFVDLPAGTEIELSVAPSNSTGVGDAVLTVPVTLTENETYIVVADGIVSPTGYNPSPPITLQVYPMGRETATDGANTDVLVHHGSTDAPTVDVFETGAGAGLIVDNISYSEYQGYLELPTADYVLEVRDETGTTGVAAYEAPLSTLGLDGAAITVLASGFLDPSQNSDGPAFGLWAALASGGALVELPGAPLGINDIEDVAISIYPNPVSDQLTISGLESNEYTLEVIDMQGRVMSTEISENTINTANLTSGIYFLNIRKGGKIAESIRFIKK